jgi:hypothetical protein
LGYDPIQRGVRGVERAGKRRDIEDLFNTASTELELQLSDLRGECGGLGHDRV